MVGFRGACGAPAALGVFPAVTFVEGVTAPAAGVAGPAGNAGDAKGTGGSAATACVPSDDGPLAAAVARDESAEDTATGASGGAAAPFASNAGGKGVVRDCGADCTVNPCGGGKLPLLPLCGALAVVPCSALTSVPRKSFAAAVLFGAAVTPPPEDACSTAFATGAWAAVVAAEAVALVAGDGISFPCSGNAQARGGPGRFGAATP